MAFTEEDLMGRLETEISAAFEDVDPPPDVSTISSALAKAIFAFLQEAAEAGDLDA